MPLRWLQLSSCLVLFWLCLRCNAQCPSICSCKGRKVICNQGGMSDPIPTSEMDAATEVIEISAPDPGLRNKLTISPIFQHLKRLTELRIRKSNVHQIGMHSFWGVPTLKLLDLAMNNIGAVVDHNFRGLVNLVELNLDDNRIRNVQSGVFKYLTELRILTLQRNLIDELVPRMFLKLGKLHVLKLSGNEFEELNPEVFKDIPELRVLECRNCGLRRINTQIYHLLPYLSHLDLGNNQMQFISSDEFHDLRHLHFLKLDGNQFPVVLEKTFIRQRELKYLCLARNRIAKITNTAFLNLSSLIDLDISYNKLDKIEMVAFQHVADSLQRLVISGNLFGADVIRNILSTVYNVREVGLSRMNLKVLMKGFVPDRVRKLDVSLNNLTDLEYSWLPKQLVELNLSGNHLQGLEETVVFKLETLGVVNVDSNPWNCRSCHLDATLLRMNRTQVFKNLTCASPKKLKGRLLSSLDKLSPCQAARDENTPLDDKLTLVVGITTSLVLFIVCIVSAFSYLRRRSVRNSLQEQKRIAEMHQQENSLDHPIAIFAKGEISFKFPLDLTERKVEVSTIDEIKKDTQTLPNGTGI